MCACIDITLSDNGSNYRCCSYTRSQLQSKTDECNERNGDFCNDTCSYRIHASHGRANCIRSNTTYSSSSFLCSSFTSCSFHFHALSAMRGNAWGHLTFDSRFKATMENTRKEKVHKRTRELSGAILR